MSLSAAIEYEEQFNRYIFDEALIIRIGREDDIHALSQLYEATERAVYAYILSIIQNPEDTADLVQETYLWVRRSAHLYIPTGKPLAWLLGIAGNLAKDYTRIHKRVPLQLNSLEKDTSYDYVADIADRIILKYALGILRAGDRQVLFLHAVAGLRHREIADYLSIPISAVQARYSRSLDKLKKYLYPLGVSL